MKTPRWLGWTVLGLLSASGFGAFWASTFFMNMVLHPPNPPPQVNREKGWYPYVSPVEVGLTAQPLSFHSVVDQHRLKGWFIPPKNRRTAQAKPAVLLVHGRGASKSAVIEYMPWLHREGYAVAALDLRAHGQSGGENCSMGMYEPRDVRGALRVLARMGYGRVAAMGFSMGATTVLMTAAQRPPGLVGVVAEAGYMDMAEVLRHNGEARYGPVILPLTALVERRLAAVWGQSPALVNIAQRWPQQGGLPAFIIQSEKDDLVPPENARRIARAIGKKARLWICPGSSHVNCHKDHPKAFEQKVSAFLKTL